jgi:predicted dehydrogenase
MIDLAYLLVGDIDKVNANLASYFDRKNDAGSAVDPANDAAMLSVQFSSGAQGMIHVSAVAHLAEHGYKFRILLHGSEGTIEARVDLFGQFEIRGIRQNEESYRTFTIPDHLPGGAQHSTPFNELLEVFTTQSAGTRLFIDAILEDKPVSPNFRDGLKVQNLIDAALESHRAARWISVS